MDYQSADHGVNINGVQQYLSDLQLGTFTKIKDAIRNTDPVCDAVKQGWVGQSADNFQHNLIKAANEMVEQINQIEEMLRTEVEGIQSAIIDAEAQLVPEE